MKTTSVVIIAVIIRGRMNGNIILVVLGIQYQNKCFVSIIQPELKPRNKERMSHYPGGSETLRDN